jgi:hypothetical protein
MNLFDRISNDIKEAMKARATIRLEALRGVKKEMLEAKSAKGATAELGDDEAIKIVQKMVKQRKDSAAIFTAQGRPELAERELAEIEAIAIYLPEQITGAELEIAVRAIVAKVGASSPAEMGKVMGMATKELAGKADGKEISDWVKKILNS